MNLTALISAFILSWPAVQADSIVSALKEFVSPEDSTRTKVWWFHGETETTKEGITADLEAFKDAGIGGVVYYDQVHGSGEKALEAMSPEWWDMLGFAASESKRIGLGFEINISNGFVAGGPWITPETGMQRLCSSELTVSGGRHFSGDLALPGSAFIYDVAVLAFPSDGTWRETGFNGSISFRKPFTARSITYTAPKARKSRVGAMNVPTGPSDTYSGMLYVEPEPAGFLEYSRDGRHFTRIAELPTCGGTAGWAQKTIAFRPVKARYFRIVDASGALVRNMSACVISSRSQTDRWEEKAAYFSEFIEGNATPQYGEGIIDPSAVINLSALMDADGHIEWDVPGGEWVIMRIASESTRGATKHGRRNLMGLECDKMSKAAARLQWESYPQRIIDSLCARGTKPKGVIMDSHEAGPQNWTRGFEKIFRERNGYDITPYLPAMRGCIVGSTDETDRFLYDLRKTIAETIALNYYSELNRLAQQAGVEFTAQAAGNGLNLVTDNAMMKGYVTKPQGEFWARDVHGSYDIVECASAAHIYGRGIASGEAFTDAKYSDSPAVLKQLADFAYASQINEFAVCASAYQPRLDEQPGNVANGRQYCLNRNNTIWPFSRPFWDYQARCAGMLRKGKPVVDLLVYMGSDVPMKTLSYKIPAVPDGYTFDVTSDDGLKYAEVHDGELVTRGGMHYRMLVVERDIRIDDAVAEQISRFKEAGLPVFTASGCFDKVDVPFEQDFHFRSKALMDDCVRFSHRRLDDADVYFVYNHSKDTFVQEDARLRTAYRRLYLLDPVDGSCYGYGSPAEFELELQPDQSAFLVATDKVLPALERPVGTRPSGLLDGAVWTVGFNPAKGGPEEPVTWSSLSFWDESDDTRIQYYSGTATYETSFQMEPGDMPAGGKRFILGFEDLNWMARVSLNGKYCGTVWCSPWALDITDSLQEGENLLNIEICNSLYNRMIGDLSLPEAERFTKSSFPLVDATTPLVRSGVSRIGIREQTLHRQRF